MSWGFKRKPNPETCTHSETITVCSSGLEREVCETCGHVSVQFMSGLTGEVDREIFARQADQLSAATATATATRDVRVRYLAPAGAQS